MAAPARARQGQHSGRIAHPSGGTRLGGLARAGLEPEGPRPTRARPSRVAQGWRLAQGLSRMATDHERPAKFSQGWQPTALRLTNSRSSSCALGVDPRSEEHTSELQSLMRSSYAVFCLKKKTTTNNETQ